MLSALEINVNFEKSTVSWENVTIDTRAPNELDIPTTCSPDLFAEFSETQEPTNVKEANKHVTRILNAKYEQADLTDIVKEQCAHLSENEQQALLKIIMEYEDLFGGTLGDFYTELVNLKMKTDTQSVHS